MSIEKLLQNKDYAAILEVCEEKRFEQLDEQFEALEKIQEMNREEKALYEEIKELVGPDNLRAVRRYTDNLIGQANEKSEFFYRTAFSDCMSLLSKLLR